MEDIKWVTVEYNDYLRKKYKYATVKLYYQLQNCANPFSLSNRISVNKMARHYTVFGLVIFLFGIVTAAPAQKDLEEMVSWKPPCDFLFIL